MSSPNAVREVIHAKVKALDETMKFHRKAHDAYLVAEMEWEILSKWLAEDFNK